MVKLTQVLFRVKEETQKKIDDMQSIMEEEYEKAKSLAIGSVPSPYRYKMKDSDYDKKETPLYIIAHTIAAIHTNFEGDTVIETSLGKEHIVKESPRKVYSLLNKVLKEEDGEG